MKYSTKVDGWLAVLMVLAFAGMMVSILTTKDRLAWIAPLFFLAIIGLLGWPCEYLLEQSQLLVRSGLIRYRIPYNDIKSVRLSRNPLSAPAWSLDRVEIAYQGRKMLVSPADREGFMRELASRANLKQFGDEWLSRY